MRRVVPIALAALLTIGFVSPVAAAKPDKFPNEPIEQTFEGSCGFDVFLEDTFAAGSVKFFAPKKDGSSRFQANGGFRSTLWREDPHIEIDVSFFGRLFFDVHGDGTMTMKQTGEALTWFTDPADAGMLGLDPGIYIISGRLDVLMDENFITLAPVDMSRVTVRDLCAELSAPAA